MHETMSGNAITRIAFASISLNDNYIVRDRGRIQTDANGERCMQKGWGLHQDFFQEVHLCRAAVFVDLALVFR